MAWNGSCSLEEEEGTQPARVGLLYARDGQAWERHLRRVLLQLSGSHSNMVSNMSSSVSSSIGSSTGGSSVSGRLSVFNSQLEQLERDVAASVTPRIAEADLQVVIVSPGLLTFVAEKQLRLDGLLDMNSTLALLLGVTEQEVTDRQVHGLRSFPMWRKIPLRDKDRHCIEEFSTFVHGMLRNTIDWQAPDSGDCNEDTVFEEKFTVSSAYCNGNSCLVVYLMMSEPADPDGGTLFVWLRGVLDNMAYQQLYEASWKNPYTAFIYVPTRSYPDQASVEVVYGNESWGIRMIRHQKRLETLGTFLETLTSPVDFLCQILGVEPSDTDELDSVLTEKFMKNCPSDFGRLRITDDLQDIETRDGRYPSLLHLAAAHGLSQLCGRLVDCPGGERALMTRNEDDNLPWELAAAADHQLLAQQLKQATELCGLSKLIPRVNQTWANAQNYDEHKSLDEWMRPDLPGAEVLVEPRQSDSPPSPLYAEARPDARAIWISQDSGQILLPTQSGLPPYLKLHTDDFDQDILPSGPYLSMHKEEYRQTPPAPPARGRQQQQSAATPAAGAPLPLLSSNGGSGETPADPGARSSTEDSGSAYHDAEDGPDCAPEMPQTTAAVSRRTLPEQAYRPSTRRPRKLRTVEDELLELLDDYRNNIYTLPELQAVAESWTQRTDFQHYLQQENRPKMGATTQNNGLLSFFIGKSKKSSQASTDVERSGHVCGGKGQAKPIHATFRSYMAPLDKDIRCSAALVTAGTRLALATAQPPGSDTVPLLDGDSPDRADEYLYAKTPSPQRRSPPLQRSGPPPAPGPSSPPQLGHREPARGVAAGSGGRPTLTTPALPRPAQEPRAAPPPGAASRQQSQLPPAVPPRRAPPPSPAPSARGTRHAPPPSPAPSARGTRHAL